LRTGDASRGGGGRYGSGLGSLYLRGGERARSAGSTKPVCVMLESNSESSVMSSSTRLGGDCVRLTPILGPLSLVGKETGPEPCDWCECAEWYLV